MEENTEYPKFWRKAIRGSVGGRILNKRELEEEFLLKGDPHDEKTDPDDITLEIFDPEAEKFFKKKNKTAIKQGYLIEISDHVLTLDNTNNVGDGELKDLLKKPLSKMRPRVEKFTSSVPVTRLLELAIRENQPVKTIEYLKGVITKLEGGHGFPRGAEIDGVKVTTTSA